MDALDDSQSIIRFGTFEVDRQSGELRKQGFKVKLQEQPFQVLLMLLDRPDQIVTREEIQKKLWTADTFVDFERGLNRAMNKLREALGDDAASPRFIETLPRRGYRLLVPVEGQPARLPGPPETSPPYRSARERPWLMPVAGVFLAAAFLLAGFNAWGVRDHLLSYRLHAPIHSIAVLPLENLSGDPAQDYFADGLTDELITQIARNASLRVISPLTKLLGFRGV